MIIQGRWVFFIGLIGVGLGCGRTAPMVDFTDLNLLIPNDPLSSSMWNMRKIGAHSVWSQLHDCTSTIVAVIDTGVDYTHVDLKDNFNSSYRGYDFVDTDSDPKDQDFHGTHVAGTIAARGNNGEGVQGVCWEAHLLAYRAGTESGGFSSSAIASAIDDAIAKNAKVINMSLGGGSYSTTMYNALVRFKNSGGITVVAAGNDNSNNDTTPAYPANYDLSNIISVGATDENDAKTYFSNFGDSVDIGAPGIRILSTMPTYHTTSLDEEGLSTHYDTLQGTSMASPLVAGAVTLLWSQHSTLSAQDVISRLYLNATIVPKLYGVFNNGRRLRLGPIL